MLSTLFGLLLSSSFALRTEPNLTKVEFGPMTCGQLNLELPNIMGKTEYNLDTSACYDAKLTHAYSQNCHDQSCDLIKGAKAFKGTLAFSDRGTPSAWLCGKLGGDSIMVYISKANKENSKDESDRSKIHICHKDKDWVSVDYLLRQRTKAKQ